MQTSDNYKMIGKSTNQSKVTQDIQSGIDNPFIHSKTMSYPKTIETIKFK